MKRRGVTKRQVAVSLGALALSAAMPRRAAAQVAGRPITIIVPYSPGTGIDILARSIATDLSNRFNQPVVVDNRTGASGNIGTGMAARAAPDGNTLLMIAKVFVVNPSLFKSVPYDPVTSFEPIIKLATGTIVLAVHPSVPANNVREFVAWVRSQPPGSVNYGSAGFATPHHLSMELFKQAAGVNLTHIPYKGTSGVMTDLIGNHVSAMFIPTHVAMPFARDRQIRVLGIAGRERSAAMPDVPTLHEQGLGDVENDLWFGLLAPAGTRPDVVARYNSAINEIIRTPEMVASLAKQGLVVSGGGPEVLRDLIVKDRAKWAKVIADAGIKAD
ncbi:MAG: tripartite tricarboxylate transporter substrate binding protein [Xanthobacteraceae bacterium]|nr:tripartite tricarboxylate transporter substrate binding protein [Xanthobacteraceae bacterium]